MIDRRHGGPVSDPDYAVASLESDFGFQTIATEVEFKIKDALKQAMARAAEGKDPLPALLSAHGMQMALDLQKNAIKSASERMKEENR